ncbi:hypothetical protein Ocin01_15943 [Orchesella cincta]|uniref:WAP domain-containing protein n=1 Tax=Orchesella cincta TaxID=48709 RepID=A0A1D2MCR8_ORCCI|nr:hypothetical protein Ocin01_15943 [Orchesella cincta]
MTSLRPILAHLILSVLFLTISFCCVKCGKHPYCEQPVEESKSGECPSTSNGGMTIDCEKCMDDCTSDAECRSNLKCCIQPYQCGNWCMKPVK